MGLIAMCQDMVRRLSVVVLLCTAAGLLTSAQAQPSMPRMSAAHDYIGLYQRYVSSEKGYHCPMYPTCSRYGAIVFSSQPFPVAMALTADRLMRCGDDNGLYDHVVVDDTMPRLLDAPPGWAPPDGVLQSQLYPAAATIVGGGTDSAMVFTSMLINERAYASALLEIERLQYTDSAMRSLPALCVNRLLCYEGMHHYADGLQYFENAVPAPAKSDYRLLYTAAHLYSLIGDNAHAIELYDRAALHWAGSAPSPYAELAILHCREGDYTAAREALNAKRSLEGDSPTLQQLHVSIDRIEALRPKNAQLAMALAVVPGAGHLYAEQPRSALAHLLLNGLMIYATYTTFASGNTGLGVLISLASLTLYSGNIAGASHAAVRWNEQKRNALLSDMRRTSPFYY